VATPMFASGHCVHQRRIVSGSMVASLHPSFVLASLPGLEQSGPLHVHRPFAAIE